jgi:uncharacterized protein
MEGTARIFASEYGGSTLAVQDNDSGNPAWIVTPGGAWCRLIFLSGALTEVAEIGDMVHIRIADPTGGFNLMIGGRNTPLAGTFRNLPIPSFVTVTGRAQMYMKHGEAILSVRPENVLVVDRLVRDQWVLATAKSTIGRLRCMYLAMQGNCADERILAAVRHYSMTKIRLRDLAVMVESAIKTAHSSENIASAQPVIRTRVVELIQAGSGKLGISVDDIIKQAAACGITQEAVLVTIESLIVDDECYQPQKGFIKLL